MVDAGHLRHENGGARARRLPAGAALIAAKHQAAWDTFALVPLTRDPAIVMKEELLELPLYGWFSRKFEMIPIRREVGPSARCG